MPINREPESIDSHAPEESAVRRAPLDQDDAYELADHEFTLVAEDAADDSRGWPYDEHTAPWSTLPPLPAWATKARALLEPPTLPRPLNDETPTLVEEGDHVSATALRALRTEIGQLLSDADARSEQIDQLERSLASAVQARAESELKNRAQATELSDRAQVQALRIVELEDELRDLEAARNAREAELEAELRDLEAARDAREAELEHEVRELKAVHGVRAAALEELRAHSAAHEKRVAELEAERRELKATRKAARAADADELRALKSAYGTQAAELDRLRPLEAAHTTQAAELAQLRALEAAKTTQAADLKRLRGLEAEFTAQAADLERLRGLEAEFAAQAAQLAELRSLRETLAAVTAQLEEERPRRAALEKRAVELEGELDELKASSAERATQLEDERQLRAALEKRTAEIDVELRDLRVALQVVRAREFDVATGIPSDSEADIETTAEWISNAPPGLEVTIEVDANDDAEVATSSVESAVSAQDSQPEPEPEPDSAPELVPTPVGAPEVSLPNPETTIEIDPDSDLVELDAAMPPSEQDTAAPSSKPRKPRQPRKPRKRPAKPRAVPRDDFQRIDGIGKSLEQRLHAKGIRTYAQLAALRPADLARVAKQIGVTPERIARESWLAQARRLNKLAAKAPTAPAAVARKQKRARA